MLFVSMYLDTETFVSLLSLWPPDKKPPSTFFIYTFFFIFNCYAACLGPNYVSIIKVDRTRITFRSDPPVILKQEVSLGINVRGLAGVGKTELFFFFKRIRVWICSTLRVHFFTHRHIIIYKASNVVWERIGGISYLSVVLVSVVVCRREKEEEKEKLTFCMGMKDLFFQDGIWTRHRASLENPFFPNFCVIAKRIRNWSVAFFCPQKTLAELMSPVCAPSPMTYAASDLARLQSMRESTVTPRSFLQFRQHEAAASTETDDPAPSGCSFQSDK